MDWKSTKFDWNKAKAFLVTAEEGSLSAAARALGTTQPTLGRQVAALEKELNISLFDRVGKQLVLTPNGLELVDHVRQMSDAATRISLIANGKSQELDGEVCISAIEAVSFFLLPPIIKKIRATYPGITINVLASDPISNLSWREADIAIRNVTPTQPDLIAKKIGDLAARPYATPEYLDNLSRPLTIEGLNSANYIGFNRSDSMAKPFSKLGLSLMPESFPVVSKNLLVQWELTKLGVGIGMMIEAVGDQEPSVERVLEESDFIVFPVWLVAHQQLKSSRRIRAVYDLLAESLASL